LFDARTRRIPLSLARGDQVADALVGEREQPVHLGACERGTFGRALHLDEAAGGGHHDVHVGVAGRVFDIFEVEQRRAFDDADRHRGDELADRRCGELAVGEQPAHRVVRSDEGAGDRRGARAAVGLEHVAIERDRAFAERLQVEHGAQRAADQALDLLRAAALLAARGFAVAAGVGGARQHAVLGRHPAFAGAALVRRHLLLDRGGTEDLGVAERDQHRALGVDGVAAGQGDGAQRVGGAIAGANEAHGNPGGRKKRLPGGSRIVGRVRPGARGPGRPKPGPTPLGR
jgi:hypothetical protein